MKALSVKQPFAGLIGSGEKTIEVRNWSTEYRGDLLIVSSGRPAALDDDELDAFREIERRHGLEILGKPCGVAIAVVSLVEVRPWRRRDAPAAWCEAAAGAFSWRLEDPRPITGRRPVRGKLRLYEVAASHTWTT